MDIIKELEEIKIPYKINLYYENKSNYTSDEINLISKIKEHFEKDLKVYNPLKLQDFSFNLPETIFTGYEKIIVYQNDDYNSENLGLGKLSKSQLKEIYKTGRFTVCSISYPLDYIWQINSWIVKGSQNIVESLYKDFSICFNLIRTIPKRIFYEKDIDSMCEVAFIYGIINLFKALLMIFDIFIGFPHFENKLSVSQIKINLLKGKMISLCESEKIDKTIFKFLCDSENTKIEKIACYNKENLLKLKEIDKDFEEIWRDKKYEIEKDIPDNEYYYLSLKEARNKLYFSEIERHFSNEPEIQNSLLNYLNASKEINKIVFEEEEKFEKEKENFIKILKIKNRIKSKVDDWLQEKLHKFKSKLQEKYHLQIENRINSSLLDFPKQKQLFNEYLEFRKNFEKNVEEINHKQREIRNPKRNYVFLRSVFPPWKIEKIKDFYYMKKNENIYFSTKYLGWRIWIILVRFWIWTNNIMFWLFFNAFIGPLGIRAFCGCSAYFPEKSCNKFTGKIEKTDLKIQTVISRFKNLLIYINEDRNKFENRPDSGFFGKNCTRIFNLFYNYFILLVFGSIICLIFIPIIIILNVILSLILSITAWLWCPIVLILFKLIQIFIYDSDSPDEVEYFPLIHFFYKFFIYGLAQTILSILLFFGQIILAFLIFLFALIRFAFRTFYDSFMIIIVKCFGRVPNTNTCIAWCISGPGISKEFYKQIDHDHIPLLIISFLEQKELEYYEAQISKQIDEPFVKAKELINKIFTVFNSKIMQDHPSEIIETSNTLKKKLTFQIKERKKLFIEFPKNVRQTKSELEVTFEHSKHLIENLLAQKKYLENIWKDFDMRPGNYQRLTRKILANIFGNNFLEPFEDLDLRIELKGKLSSNFEGIIKILNGNGNELESLSPMLKNRSGKRIQSPPYFSLGNFVNKIFVNNADEYVASYLQSMLINVSYFILKNSEINLKTEDLEESQLASVRES